MKQQPKTLGQRMEAVAVLCLLACLGALGLHAATQTTTFDPVAATVGNARLLSLAIVQYEQDNDQRLPNTQTVAAFQTALRPYVPDPAVFNSRVTGKPFVPNPALSGRTLTEFPDPSIVEVFRDTFPPSTVPATVGFLDNHIEHGGVVTSPTQSSYSTAKALSLGVIQYTQDYDELYPPMKTQAAFQAAVRPYVPSSRVFVDPANGKPFVPNPALSQVSIASIGDPAHTVVFQSDTPYLNGIPTVAYADGHVTPAPPATPSGLAAADASNLRLIGLAVTQYTQDADEHYPTTTDYPTFENQLLPYTKNADIFVSPGSGLPYVLNPAVSGVTVASLADPTTTELARDAQLNPDGRFNTLEADGHVNQSDYFLPKSLLAAPDDATHLLWQSAAPQTALWTLSPSGSILKTSLGQNSSSILFSAGPDGQVRLLGTGSYGLGVSTVAADGTLQNSVSYGIYDGWGVSQMATGTDNSTRLLWQRTDGLLALWTLTPANDYAGSVSVQRIAGGTVVGMAVGSDNLVRLLWKTASGNTVYWTLASSGRIVRVLSYQSPSGQAPTALAVGADGSTRLLWSDTGGHASVLTVTSIGRAGRPVGFTLPGGGTASQIAVGKRSDLRVLWSAGTNSQLQTLSAAGRQTSVQSLTPYL